MLYLFLGCLGFCVIAERIAFINVFISVLRRRLLSRHNAGNEQKLKLMVVKLYNTVNSIMCVFIIFCLPVWFRRSFMCLTWMNSFVLSKVLCGSKGLFRQKSVGIYQPLPTHSSFLLPGSHLLICILILCSFNGSLIINHQRKQIFLISQQKNAFSSLNLCTNIDATLGDCWDIFRSV